MKKKLNLRVWLTYALLAAVFIAVFALVETGSTSRQFKKSSLTTRVTLSHVSALTRLRP